VSDILDRAFGPEFQTQDRPLRLTYMTLRKFIGTPMLSDCKEYWKKHSTLITCFPDLRPLVQDLEGGDQREFYEFIQSHAKQMGVNLGSDQVCIQY
jgi:N-terminal acetyltransferase B complex non-catalytic subunit